MSRHQAETDSEPIEGGRITVFESIAYTAVLAMIVALALGTFDAMLRPAG